MFINGWIIDQGLQLSLLKSDELTPGTFKVRLVLLLAVRYAPAVQSIWIDFNLGANIGCHECLFELYFYLGLPLVVIGRNRKIEACLNLRSEQVWTVGLVGGQKASVGRSAGTYAVGQCRRGLQNVDSTQTIAVGSHFPLAIYLSLGVQECSVGSNISLCRAGCEESGRGTTVLLL